MRGYHAAIIFLAGWKVIYKFFPSIFNWRFMMQIRLVHTPVIILSFFFFLLSDFAQSKSVQDGEADKFNFWVGEWNVFKADSQKAGASKIEKILQGAVILENYSAQTGYEGKSFNYFDKEKNKWIQFWVDKNSQSILFEGSYDERQRAMVYFSYDKNVGDKPYIRRMRFFNIDSNTVRQFSERTYDNGKSWHTEYDLLYKRVVN